VKWLHLSLRILLLFVVCRIGPNRVPGLEFRRHVDIIVYQCNYVLTIVGARGFENFVFTTYRVEFPEDVLTEKMVGSATVTNQQLRVIWCDAGNFKIPWKHGQEAVLIVEATKNGEPYHDVIDYVLDEKVDYALPKQTHVNAVIYDVSGRQVKTILSGEHAPGYYSTTWDGTDNIGRTLPSGIYFIKFEAGEHCARDKILLIK